MVLPNDRCGAQSTAPAPCPFGDGLVRRRPGTGGAVGPVEIRTVEDLLLHRPRRYEDRPPVAADCQLAARRAGDHARQGRRPRRQVAYSSDTKSIFELILDDGTARLHCRWWNLPFMEKYFEVGNEVIVFGKPVVNSNRARWTIRKRKSWKTAKTRFIHFGSPDSGLPAHRRAAPALAALAHLADAESA